MLTGTALAVPASVTVKPGDTLFRLANRYGLSVAQLRAINGLNSDTILVGQTLRLGGPPKAAGTAGAGRYTVRPGDSLAAIAARAGISVAALQAANGLRGSMIRAGQVLQVPARGQKARVVRPSTEVRLIYSYVRVGLRDTPEALAQRYRTTPDALRRLNGLGSRSHIVPGLKLLVPQRLPVPIPPPATGRALTFKTMRPLNVPVQLVRVDLRHRDVLVAPVLPRAGLSFGMGARVGQLAQRSGARALINGSYFHPRTYAPAGDLVMQGRMLTWGRIPMALAITPDNRATIRSSTTPLLLRPLDATWRGMETVIATGPRIVAGGRLFTDYNAVFRDPAVFGRAARSAVGLSSNRDLVLVSTRARLTATEMGKIMTRLGVKDALLLDGGSSAGLAWNGQAVADSVRRVSYGIGVFTGYTGRRYAR
ncbi:LysM peptidoglycan-binding domain-containing protein [Deinococcus navajonensis]|uniref:LysM peptidoglycan-binding domain-containing protein n=1 Tax=Deinococcus navajonensis TaxID=309884 RepID=UPI0036D3FD24